MTTVDISITRETKTDPLVLVTGAAGFIGSAVVSRLSNLGYQVVAVDALLGGLYPREEKVIKFEQLESLAGVATHKLDLRTDELDSLPSGITHVINEAAMPGLGLSWTDFELYSSCNLSATARLLDAAKAWQVEKFIQISTSSVYGKNAVGDETLPTAPVSPYGATKLAAEQLALAHWRDSGLPVSILRYFSVYGPGQRPDMAYRKFISRALAGLPIDLYGSGEQSRSNTYIDDCAEVTIGALHRSTIGEIYNIAGSEERTINDALAIIEAHLGTKLTINRWESARGDQDRTFGDTGRAQKDLMFSHSVNLEQGLQRQIDWQKTNGL